MPWIHWSVFGDKAESAGFRTSLSEEEGQLVGDVGPLRQMSMTRRRAPLVVDSSRWWFQWFCWLPLSRGNDPIWQIQCLKWAESTNSFIYLYHCLPQKLVHRMNPWICFNTKDGLCNQFATPCSAEGKLFAPPWEAHHYLVLDLNAGTEAAPVPWSFCLGTFCSFKCKCLGTHIPQKKGTCQQS